MALGIESTGGGVFVPNPSGRVDQADQAIAQAQALHAAGIRHAGALHPNFIQPLVSGLSPTEDELTWAGKVVEEYEKLADTGESVGTFEGKVIDKYEYEAARETLEWAEACAAKDRYKARALARAQAEEKAPG
jgi:citrate lyase subunit beta/citryl-CoA lyase